MRQTLALVLSMLASGCSASRPPAPVALEPLAREQWPAAAARAFCEAQLEQCWAQGGADVALHERVSVEVCATQVLGYADFVAWVGITDSVTYDGVLAAECVEQLAANCWQELIFDLDPFEAFPACREAFVGTLPDGAACASRFECAPGLWCERPTVLTADRVRRPCSGVCRPRLAAGVACLDDAQCVRPDGEPFAVCTTEFFGPDGVCAQATLVLDAARDEPCGVIDSPTGERSMVICARGLACTEPPDPTAPLGAQTRCVAPLPAGAACGWSGPCVAGHACLPEDGSPDGICGPVEISAAGEPCDEALGSPQCDPSTPLVCREGRCASLPELAEGDACEDAIGPLARCTTSLACMSDTQRCEPTRPVGNACTQAADCVTMACDRETDSCVDPASACPASI